MKEHEFLDGINNIDDDVVGRFIDMDNQLQKKALIKAKARGRWLRIGVIAACCSIFVCAALITVPLFIQENNLDGFDHLTDTNADNDGAGGGKHSINANYPDAPIYKDSNGEYDDEANEPEAPIESADVNDRPDIENPNYDEELPGEDIEEPELVLNINIADERYSDYEIPGYFCSPDSVGEKIGEINLEVGYGFELNAVRAEVYKVEGLDVKLCLCMRYTDNGDSNAIDGILELDAYYFLWAKSYSFDSLESVWNLKLDDSSLNVGSSISYYKNTSEDYPKDFFLFDGVMKAELVEIVLSAKGVGLDPEGGMKFEKVHAEADEIVTLYCNFTSKIGFFHGQMRVYDTGYLYLSTMGGQLFEIGEDAAKEIISFITTNGAPDGYVEGEDEWHPIIPDEDAEYETFRVLLEETKLFGQLSFENKIGYWEDCYGGISPDGLHLDAKYLFEIAEILCAADGYAVEIEDVTKIANESLTFEQVFENGDRCSVVVYDSGYVWIFERFYFINEDAEYTEKIFNVVRSVGTSDSNFYWNKKEQKWEIGEKITSVGKDTSPKMSEDHGYGVDETEIDIPYETEIHY